MRLLSIFFPVLVVACTGGSASGPTAAGAPGKTGGGEGTEGTETTVDSGASGSTGGPSGAAPEVAVTRGCTTDDEIRFDEYGSKGSLVGNWDITKACAPNFLEAWNDTVHPANKLKAVTGKARARWVFTDTTLQRTVSWEVVETVEISKIVESETCEQHVARYVKTLETNTASDRPRYYDLEKPIVCKDSASGDDFYACSCDFTFSSYSNVEEAELFTDPQPLGYLVSSRGVTTGDQKLDFKSDATTLTTQNEGLIMVLTKK